MIKSAVEVNNLLKPSIFMTEEASDVLAVIPAGSKVYNLLELDPLLQPDDQGLGEEDFFQGMNYPLTNLLKHGKGIAVLVLAQTPPTKVEVQSAEGYVKYAEANFTEVEDGMQLYVAYVGNVQLDLNYYKIEVTLT